MVNYITFVNEYYGNDAYAISTFRRKSELGASTTLEKRETLSFCLWHGNEYNRKKPHWNEKGLIFKWILSLTL